MPPAVVARDAATALTGATMCTLRLPLHSRTQQLRVGAEALVAAAPVAAHVVPFEARAGWSLRIKGQYIERVRKIDLQRLNFDH